MVRSKRNQQEIEVKMEAKELIINYRELYKEFDARKYKKAFENYTKEVYRTLSAINQEIEENEDPEFLLKQNAIDLVSAVKAETIENSKILLKSTRKLRLDDYRLTLAFFVFPMLEESKLKFSRRLAQAILNEWKKEDLGEIEIAKYRDLLKGFERSMLDLIIGKNG